MRLFAAELRKLLNPRLLLIAVVLSSLYGYVFLAPQFKQLTADHPTYELHQLTVRAAKQFGTEISASEYRTWQRQYQQLEAEADNRIAGASTLRQLKIHTWNQLTRVTNRNDERAQRARDAARPLLFDNTPGRAGLGYTLQSFQGLLDDYALKAKSATTGLPRDGTAERGREGAVIRSGSWRGIQDSTLIQVIPDFTRSLTVLVILVILLIAAPLPVTDTVRRMRALQYSSRRGRSVFTVQLAATLTFAVLAGAVACISAGLTFAANQVGPFLHTSLWSYRAFPDYRSDQPLITALLLSAVILLSIATATGGTAFLLARWSSHYTGLLVRLVIAFALLVTITTNVLDAPFTVINSLWQLTSIPAIETITASALAIAALVASAVLVRREHSTDLP